jgi:cell division cycle protein 37
MTDQSLSAKDALELSDDSDIEVHPNVDKRSFIRAKQNQIHQERQQRKLQIETLKYERVINDGLLSRITNLLAALRARAHETADRNPGEVAFQALMESADLKDNQPPSPPEGVYTQEKEQPTYTKMMVTLLDQVNKALDEKKPDDRYTAMVEEIQGHQDKVSELQNDLVKKLAELEKEETKKITSEAYHTGFDSSHVSKASEQTGDSSGSKVELLNPNFDASRAQEQSSSSASKDADQVEGDEEIEASPAGKKFAALKPDEYTTSAQFIAQNPQILSEKETDGILVMAFDAALEGKKELSRAYVHQALLLQYCRSLGRDGVAMFFKRITTRGHQAQGVFNKDIQDTHSRIWNRAREIIAERAKEEAEGGVEQIQLHAVEPGTVINISVPPADSDDPEVKRAREIFEGFAPEMRKALESGSLDKVNKVLGDMKVADAEELVSLFGEVCLTPVSKNSTLLTDTTLGRYPECRGRHY